MLNLPLVFGLDGIHLPLGLLGSAIATFISRFFVLAGTLAYALSLSRLKWSALALSRVDWHKVPSSFSGGTASLLPISCGSRSVQLWRCHDGMDRNRSVSEPPSSANLRVNHLYVSTWDLHGSKVYGSVMRSGSQHTPHCDELPSEPSGFSAGVSAALRPSILRPVATLPACSPMTARSLDWPLAS